ncbi:MAG: hypothetical protein Q8K30_04245 [Candidatus Gracilibacteria bacterium]|nr:hypothetical protein [Candidatus Gracilibacteria bacterium]
MRDIEKRAHETQKFLQEREEKENQEYKNGDDSNKQNYWDRIFCRNWWHSDDGDFPVQLSEFRQKNSYLESNFDRFIQGIMLALEDLGFTGSIEDIFILDEQAKKYLATHSSLSSHSKQVENIVNGSAVKKNKTSSIEGVEFSSEELAERVGNLFYDSLTGFVSLLGQEIKKGDTNLFQVGEYLKKASFSIYNAWTICLPYVGEGFPNLKHSDDIKGIEISREELVERIANLTDDLLKKFLLDLSKKIHKDGLADEGRGRKKLATELFEASKNIELAGNSL